tara:strand:+ start:25954 stop:26196 length:243 start_codon:yes stop_codon:yes gene_type:complete
MTKKKNLITTSKEEREQLSKGRLYPTTFDKAILSESPDKIIYSRKELIKIILADVTVELDVIEEYLDELASDLSNRFKII